MIQLSTRLLFSFLIFIVIWSCHEKYDSALETPDIDDAGMSHGFNLTPLGCLLHHPWAYNDEFNPKTFIDSNLQKQIVFEFQRDGTLKYWFKKDYLKSPIDTVIDLGGNKGFSRTILPSTKLKLKNIYTYGTWIVNFKDSSIKIDFGVNNFSLLPIKGKYITLSSSDMDIQQQIFDSSRNKRNIKTVEHFTVF